MNRDRRTVIGNIFANAATYTLTAGAISGILSGNFNLFTYAMIGMVFIVFALLAYFVTPKDKKKEDRLL
jgi:hypothetical protein